MDRFLQRVFQRVGRRERREVGEHDFFEAHVVEHRLKDQRALFQLSGGENDDAHHGQPVVAEQAGEDQDHRDGIADGDGAPRCRGKIERAREERAHNASAIERIGGHKVSKRDVKICPHHAAGQVARLAEKATSTDRFRAPAAVMARRLRKPARTRFTSGPTRARRISRFHSNGADCCFSCAILRRAQRRSAAAG